MGALGNPSKTWQPNFNNAVAPSGSALSDHRSTLLGIKNALLGFAASPWTCRASSNSLVAGHDSVDRWAAGADLVWANSGSAHSWIVLRQAGLGNAEVLFTLNQADANGTYLEAWCSPSGAFAGGTTTARPTAADEQQFYAGSWLTGSGTAVGSQILWNVQQTDDGHCTRFFAFCNNVNLLFCQIERLGAPESGVTAARPYCLLVGGSASSDRATYAALSGDAAGAMRPAGANATCRWASLGFFGNSAPAGLAAREQVAASPYTLRWPATEVWAWDYTNACVLGRFSDLHLGSRNRGNGDGYAVGGTNYVWGHVGNVITPTGGTQLQKL